MPSESIPLALAERIAARSRNRGDTLIVGVCGPQGSGKTTLTSQLRQLLEERRIRTAALSLDDFYLTRAEREALAHAVHPLLRTRGVPGTHDAALARAVLAALQTSGSLLPPRFDKASDDRAPQSEWARVAAPVDVVLFEGWCVGATPQSEAELQIPVNELERTEDPHCVWRRYVNDALANEYQTLFGELDLLVLLAAPDFEVVYRWRSQQEEELKAIASAQGRDVSALMDAQRLARFIHHFERLTKRILAEMPARADFIVRLDADRRGVLVDCNNRIDSDSPV